jgi:hypothetical protein
MDGEDVDVEVEAAADAEDKFMVATIVVAVVEQVGDRTVGEDEPLESTPQVCMYVCIYIFIYIHIYM